LRKIQRQRVPNGWETGGMMAADIEIICIRRIQDASGTAEDFNQFVEDMTSSLKESQWNVKRVIS
jgi:hypothetical protein